MRAILFYSLSLIGIMGMSCFNIELLSLKALNLQRWLVENGGYVHPNLVVDVSPIYGYGLRAKGVIKPYEKLCIVPESLCFTFKQVVDSGTPNVQAQLLEKLASLVCLEKAKGDRSKYKPFLDVLPDDVSYIPALWADSKLRAIEGVHHSIF